MIFRVRSRAHRSVTLESSPGGTTINFVASSYRMSSPQIRRAAALILVAGSCLLSSTAHAYTCQLDEAITYGTYVDAAGVTRPLLLDLLLPVDSPTRTPIVIWVHGGGWQSGTRTPMPTRAANMCSMGYAVASVDYRLTNVAAWPAQIQDVKGAVRFLRRHANEYNLDPGRFGVWGSSAGGHLAAMLGTTGGLRLGTVGNVTVDLEGSVGGNQTYSSRVQAVVTWYGLFDFLQERFYPLTRNPEATTSYEGKLIGGAIQLFPERSATASPITFASADDPPFLVMHGSADLTTPFNQSELLVDALTDAGGRARLYPGVGAQHSASYFDTATHRRAVYDFFADALASASPPSDVAAPTAVSGGIRVEAVDAVATESGDSGRFRVSRGGSLSSSVLVTFTVTGTATHASDYAHLARTITIPAGATSATVDLVPLEDDLREATETVIVTLAPSALYALDAPRTASVAIRDNDNASSRLTVSMSAIDRIASEQADSGRFMLTRTGGTADPLTVDLEWGGTASNGVDYTRVPTTITFASGVQRLNVLITPVSDPLTEGAETVTLHVVPSTAIYVGPYDRAVVSIADHVSQERPLPDGWEARDIGAVGVAGSSREDAGTFMLTGGGADVWGTSDAFHFAYRPMNGDGTIVARVASISGTQAWTKMGVMIRASTSASSAHAFMLVSSAKGLAFQRRVATGASTAHTSGGAGTAPRWVKLVRAGNVITGSVSTDGVAWTVVGSDTFSMPSTVLVGLVAHSHDVTRTAAVSFDHVALDGPAEPTPTLPPDWQTRDIGAVGIAGSASESAGTFRISGAGADVWGTADALHFTSRVLVADGTIVARVATISGTEAWTKVGVMIRETVDPGSAHAFMLVSKGKGIAFQRRTVTHGVSTHTAGPAGTSPRWVRLERRGNTITGSVSTDGSTWTVVGSDTFTFGGAMHAGLAVSSHDAAQLANATFDRVSVVP